MQIEMSEDEFTLTLALLSINYNFFIEILSNKDPKRQEILLKLICKSLNSFPQKSVLGYIMRLKSLIPQSSMKKFVLLQREEVDQFLDRSSVSNPTSDRMDS